MNELLERLRAANACLDGYFSAAAGQHGTFGKERKWESLTRVAAVVAELNPALQSAREQHNDRATEEQLAEYSIYLKRLQSESEAAISDLSARRKHLWQQEQELRARNAWQKPW